MIMTDTPEISLGRIEAYGFCPQAYVLDTMVREASLPLTGFVAKRYWLKHAFHKLLPEEQFVGPQLLPLEGLGGQHLASALKYKSPEKFGNATRGGWSRYVIRMRGTIHGREIVWLYRNQWWKAAHEIGRTCQAYYERLVEAGLPLDDLSDVELAVTLEGKKFSIRLGAIRPGAVIEEWEARQLDEKELERDRAVTLRIAAFYALAREQEAYRMKWGLEPDLKLGDIKFRQYSLADGSVCEVTRTESDVAAALSAVADVEARIAARAFGPNHRSCSACRYNVIGPNDEPVCRKKNEGIGERRLIDVMHTMDWFEDKKRAEPKPDEHDGQAVTVASSSRARARGPRRGKSRGTSAGKACVSGPGQLGLFD